MRVRIIEVIRNPAWLAFTWFGMTAGISLLATPVRFSVTSMSRPVALDVSRTVFTALNKAEFVALILLLIIIRTSGRAKDLWAFGAILALILIVQSLWLLPELSARTDQIIAGVEPSGSFAHGAYSVLELCKLGLLALLGLRSMAEFSGGANRRLES